MDRKLLWRTLLRCAVVLYLWICCLAYVSLTKPAPPTLVSRHHVPMTFEAPDRP